MLIGRNIIVDKLRALGYEDSDNLVDFLYDNLARSFNDAMYGTLSLKGFVGVDDSDIYRIIKIYTEYKGNINHRGYQMISMDSRDIQYGYKVITELIQRANKGERFVIVFRNIDDNDDMQRDLVEFANSLTGINAITLEDKSNIDLFYSTGSTHDLTDELQDITFSQISYKDVSNKHKLHTI